MDEVFNDCQEGTLTKEKGGGERRKEVLRGEKKRRKRRRKKERGRSRGEKTKEISHLCFFFDFYIEMNRFNEELFSKIISSLFFCECVPS